MNNRDKHITKSEAVERGTPKASNQWERPPFGEKIEEKSPRLRLNVKRPEKRARKGCLVNQFLLREEAEEVSESQETIRTKRREFKALFEAGMNR